MRMSERVSVCDAFVNWPQLKIKRKGEKAENDGPVILLVGDW